MFLGVQPAYGLEQSASAALAHYQSVTPALPPVPPEALASMEAGESVFLIPDDTSGNSNDATATFELFGIQVIEAPRILVWLAVLGGDEETHAAWTKATLSTLPAGGYIRYQHVDLPWPLRDRHWVIRCVKNVDLARSTGGEIWQHRWDLVDSAQDLVAEASSDGRIPRLSRRAIERAIYLPANSGAWTVLELGAARSLVIVRMKVGLGDAYPRALVSTFATRHLREGFETISALSERVHETYTEHPAIYDGFGQPIPTERALRAALGRLSPTTLAKAEGL